MVDFDERYFGRPPTTEPMSEHVKYRGSIHFNTNKGQSISAGSSVVESIKEPEVTAEAAAEQAQIRTMLRINGTPPIIGA